MNTRRVARRITKIKKDFESNVEEVRKADIKTVTKFKPVNPNLLVPTGSTLFNLQCSGRIEGAFLIGKMVNIIGDSHAGKTLFCLTVFSECSVLPRFDNYRFIFDDIEAANAFDIPYLFGETTANRLELLDETVDRTGLKRSRTIEDFNDNLATCLSGDQPFIYVLDSFDALTSEAAIEKDNENRKNRAKGNQIKGSYGDGKARKASEMFSQRIQELSKHKSILIIISQTRDNIGFGAMFKPKTRSGGNALRFYAFHEAWLACGKKEKKGKRTIVTNVIVKVTKNKLNGKHGDVEFPILFEYGIDNIMSCVNFLLDEGDWTGTKANVNTNGFVPKKKNKNTQSFMSIAETIKFIENNNMEQKLFQLCQETYNNIMISLNPKRKRKY